MRKYLDSFIRKFFIKRKNFKSLIVRSLLCVFVFGALQLGIYEYVQNFRCVSNSTYSVVFYDKATNTYSNKDDSELLIRADFVTPLRFLDNLYLGRLPDTNHIIYVLDKELEDKISPMPEMSWPPEGIALEGVQYPCEELNFHKGIHKGNQTIYLRYGYWFETKKIIVNNGK